LFVFYSVLPRVGVGRSNPQAHHVDVVRAASARLW
jgi:hypothetical protein